MTAKGPISRDLPRVFVARHCITDWNLAGRLQGSQDMPLNAQGRQQAEMLLPAVAACGIDAIYASPYQRAWQTASIYAEHLGVPLRAAPGLREIDHGDWEGQSIAALLADEQSGYRSWLNDPALTAIPGGESMSDASNRIASAVADIVTSTSARTLLLVTHKHVRALLTCRLLGLPLGRFASQIEESQAPAEVPPGALAALVEQSSR